MRVRNRPGAMEYMAKYPQHMMEGPEKWQEKWQERSGNNHPIHIEIGLGRSRFIHEVAKAHPEISYIGVDMQLSIPSIASDKLVVDPLSNLQLLRVDGEVLAEYLAENEVDLIYLNFLDPWPKKKHEKRRLTYKSLLVADEITLELSGGIHLKTDDQGLFEYSLSSFSKYGMIIECAWSDSYNSELEGNTMTEHEEKLSSRGQRIHRIEAYFVTK